MTDRLPYEPQIGAAVSALVWDATEGRNPRGMVNLLRRMASEAREIAYRYNSAFPGDQKARETWEAIALDLDYAWQVIDGKLARRGKSD